ncbi:MAG TPA: metalloregulator ArsR/SmtB family transcription factor [Chloroflexota bacterium]|nr:metalloregulator ArsR/SmtB family transcription factor [Chloroflexota bacterium]
MHANSELVLPPDRQVEIAADTFRMLADPTRIRLLSALSQGEQSVTCLAEIVGSQAPAVSQHLSRLRLAGIVRQRRAGNFVFYSVSDVHASQLLNEALSHADHLARHLPDHLPTSIGKDDHVLQHH